ncbi:unnamed protein product [Arabis nemorensis]|uniref:Uncharacterized protein n=1 Tax=Arabis nemorensis TaxID=586526 RepID=A0A565CQW9_9BRAS|nr:unnamed protein product [Arabis nemorensis]
MWCGQSAGEALRKLGLLGEGGRVGSRRGKLCLRRQRGLSLSFAVVFEEFREGFLFAPVRRDRCVSGVAPSVRRWRSTVWPSGFFRASEASPPEEGGGSESRSLQLGLESDTLVRCFLFRR